MKKRNYLMLALAAMAFAACSENVIPDDTGSGGVIDPKGEAWVALNVQTTSKTRGLNAPNQDTGTANESKITSVKAIFFDGHATTSEVTRVVDFPAGDDFINNQSNRSNAFKVPASSEAVLIVANPVNLPAITEKTPSTPGTTYATVNAAVADITDVTAGVAKSESFLMTNAKGGLEPSKADGSAERLSLYSTAAQAESSPLTIRLDRVVAKVRVMLDNTGDALSTSATISDAAWYLNVTNKKYFPVSVRTETALNTLTPFDQYGLGSYRIDPNYGDGLNPIGA
ncbi:MAG: fimbrial protein [Bacteroides sp.]|nr:fimbrial protein [Bacteroides sp.]